MPQSKILYLDLESFSATPITHGTHVYAANAEILLLAYAVDDGEVKVIEQPNDELTQLLLDNTVVIVAHNAQFDRTVLRHAWQFETDISRWHCTMAQALAHSLPGSLGDLCQLYHLSEDQAKTKDGKRLIQLFCKPQPANRKIERATKETHPEDWDAFRHYAAQDIVSMRELHARMPKWNYQKEELELWHLDQRINDRGVAVDMDLVNGALTAVAQEKKRLSKEANDMTGGAVSSTNQRDAVLEYVLKTHGVTLPDLKTSTIERRINDPDLPEPVRELLRVRLAASMSSTAKFEKFEKCTSADGRLRGTLQYCGASRTGRWAGRLVQLQNMPRGSVSGGELDAGIEALKQGCADLIAPDVNKLASSVLRGCIVAPPGMKLVVSDLSNIEGRVAAWTAEQEWKVQAFKDFDAGNGADLYKLAYSKSFSVPVDSVTKEQRQLGKIQELALGYGGSVGAFTAFANIYGVDLEAMAEQIYPTLPDDYVEKSIFWFNQLRKNGQNTYGLSRDVFVACDGIKRAWRDAHPKVVKLWELLQNGVTRAIENRNKIVEVKRLRIVCTKTWLRIKLPSGRCLCYPSPRIEQEQICYSGIDQYTRKWGRIRTYGGKIFENVCQAIARDVLAHGLAVAETSGYAVVSSVHDELITECPDTDSYGPLELSAFLALEPPWAKGMPLAAAGYEAYRYRKD